ncbi:MAG: hypothetical protein O7E54_04040 [Planctomycetota bacterium]|jgi:hypothetical protein|nr:hypothetical protein [Planctomycetota bacterium]
MSPVCSNCGDLFDEGPPVCPHCGADADQDWTDDSYTPEFDFETGSGEMDDHSYGEFIQAEGLNPRLRPPAKASFWVAFFVVAGLVALLLVLI